MTDNKLKQQLDQLHNQLHHVEGLDEGTRKRLQQVTADINALLARSEPASKQEHEELAGRLTESLRRFEASHPSLTSTVYGVVNTLNNMGF